MGPGVFCYILVSVVLLFSYLIVCYYTESKITVEDFGIAVLFFGIAWPLGVFISICLTFGENKDIVLLRRKSKKESTKWPK